MPDILISAIQVDPIKRQREDLGDLEGLAGSIKEYGLLEPVLLDDAFNLIAGFRRLTACISLGMERIKYENLGSLDPIRAQEIELEENVRRHQLGWQEQAKAISTIHKMKMERDPDWTAEKTAASVGVARRTVFNNLELADNLEKHPEIGKAETQQGAMLRLKTIKQIDQRKEDVEVRKLAIGLGIKRQIDVKVHQGDALTLMKALPDASFDFGISNPPYGVDIENLFIGEKTVYEDAHQDIVPLVARVVKEMFRVLKNDRWFCFFYPTVRLEEGLSILEAAGFVSARRPCIWYKPNKHLSSLGNPWQQFNCQYETFWFAKKGEPRFNKLRTGDVFVYDTPDRSDRIHPLQMPPEFWMDILEIGSVEGEKVIEPFAGSGSGGIACVRKNRSYDGLELSTEFASRANMWIGEELTGGTVVPEEEVVPTKKLTSAESALAIEALKALEK